MTIIVGISIILNVRYPNKGIKHWIKNKEVTAPPVTSKKGRDIMLTLQAILIGLTIHITSKIVDVIVDAIN